MIARFLYTLLLWLLMPYVFFHLYWRGRKQPEYLLYINERFGFYKKSTSKPVLWLHTVSVGETRAAATLISRLLATYPNHQILLTHTTPTGREASEQLYGDQVQRVYLPYDYPFAVRRFLRHFRPSVGILLETEIWFNLIRSCHQQAVPLLLLNARLSEKSFMRYARFPELTRLALRDLTQVAAQTNEDAQRLTQLGAINVGVMGNLKFDITPPAPVLEHSARLRELFGNNRQVFLAASTRDGEETLILQALKQALVSNLLCVIVPRHPQRFDEVRVLIEREGYSVQLRSKNEPIKYETQIVLGDSMGEMFAYYAASDVALIGGSLLPFGGQNLIEACAVGTPVLIGPHTYNFQQVSELAVQCGAALRIENFSLVSTLQKLFSEASLREQMSKSGLEFVRKNRGATEKALALVTQVLNNTSARPD